MAAGGKRAVPDRLADVRAIVTGGSQPTDGVNVGAANCPEGRRNWQPGKGLLSAWVSGRPGNTDSHGDPVGEPIGRKIGGIIVPAATTGEIGILKKGNGEVRQLNPLPAFKGKGTRTEK